MYDFSQEKGTQFIIMEYVPGEDLRSLIKRIGQFTPGKTLLIAKQICEGLAEAHRLGIIHRDLKPQNIMIDREGNARIMDFGIARTLKSRGLTEGDTVIGTPEYMSPEQVEGWDIDNRSDLYSLGAILFEMLTGRVPFEGETPFSIALKHKSEPPPDPRKINNQIPEGFSQLILHCLEKDRKKRFQSAEELLTELNRIEKGVPTTDRVLPDGERKRIQLPWKKIAVYAGIPLLLALIIIAGTTLFTGRQESIYSIAVLPLKNLSGNPDQEFLADGMTEALISNLTQIKALQRVISSTSVMQYKNAQKPLPVIARELDVDAIVEGSILASGQRVKINIRLIEAKTDRNLWSKSYERDLSDILLLQNELARSVANEIQITVAPAEKALLAQTQTTDPEAYQLYLKGRHFWNKRTEEGLETARGHFEGAIEKDPDYALAYAGLADTYNMLGTYAYLPSLEVFPKAKRAALKALELDETLTEAYISLAYVKYVYDWDWFGAEADLNWAIGLNPSYATAHHYYGIFLKNMGRFDEALLEMAKARNLDPLSLPISTSIGYLLYQSGQYDQAIRQCQKVLEIDTEFPGAHRTLGLIYLKQSMVQESLEELRRAVEYSGGSPLYSAELALAYASAGNQQEAQKILEELQELALVKYVPNYSQAIIYAALGEVDQAFLFLEKSFEEKSSMIAEIKVDPNLDSLRSDPRFSVLREKMGL
jgi:serine/threonine protein kinase/Tfp pilus assembly protein PilF